jgi:mono/diheme cytochrome c family protein
MMSLEIKGAILGVIAGLGVLGATFGLSPLLQPNKAHQSKRQQDTAGSLTPIVASAGEPSRGSSLFNRNCAHCHGDDARGDEGPSLHNLLKSDARLTRIIKGGIKGEMPSFVKKFNDADVQDLIEYLHTLKD